MNTLFKLLSCFIIILTSILQSQAQPTDRPANYAGSRVRFKALIYYSADVDDEHLAFTFQTINFLKKLTVGNGFQLDVTACLTNYTYDQLQEYSVIVSPNTVIQNPEERNLFEKYMENGGGWVGFHDSGYNDSTTTVWPWLCEFLGGCKFKCNNWPPQPFLAVLDKTKHPVTKNLPKEFVIPPCEFFEWDHEPRENKNIEVLVSASKKNFPIGLKDIVYGGDMPIVWTNKNYRMIYLNIGHGDEEYMDATQNLLIFNAFRWIVSRDPKGNPFDL